MKLSYDDMVDLTNRGIGHPDMTLTEDGLWCTVCGECIAAPWNLDEDYTPPDCCPCCGWPDEFDPDAV